MPFDGEEFGKNIVAAVNASIERQLEPVMRRLDTVENVIKAMSQSVRTVTETVSRAAEIDTVRGMLDDVRAGLESTIGPELQELVSVQIVEAVGKAVEAIPVPKDGKDVDMDAVRSMIVEAMPAAPELPDIAGMVDEAVSKAVEAIPAPKDGTSVTLDDVRPLIDEAVKAIELPAAPELPDIAGMVDEAVSKAVEAIPAPKDGTSVTLDDVRPLIDEAVKAIELPAAPELPDIAGMITEAVKAIPIPPAPELPDIAGMIDEAVKSIEIPVPRDGVDVDMEAVNKRVDAAIDAGIEAYHKIVKEIPVPRDGEDGKSVTLDDVRPLIDDAVSKAVALIPIPKDGRDGVDAVEPLINADGHLIFTMSDGRVRNVGRVVGKDGDDGVDCDIDGVWKILNEKLAALPPPKDGADGLGFDDLNVEYDGERTIKFVMSRGDQRKEFEFTVPVILDRGLFAAGKSYAKGDCVTWAGSTWIAQTADATDEPGTSKQWRLSVKRGSRGKDGALLAPRENKPVKIGV